MPSVRHRSVSQLHHQHRLDRDSSQLRVMATAYSDDTPTDLLGLLVHHSTPTAPSYTSITTTTRPRTYWDFWYTIAQLQHHRTVYYNDDTPTDLLGLLVYHSTTTAPSYTSITTTTRPRTYWDFWYTIAHLQHHRTRLLHWQHILSDT